MRSADAHWPARTTSMARFMVRTEVALRQRQRRRGVRRSAAHLGPAPRRFQIDLDLRAGRIVNHVLLADLAGAFNSEHGTAPGPISWRRLWRSRLRRTARAGDQAAAEGAEHRPIVDGLRCRDRALGSPIGAVRSADPASVGLSAEEGRRPDHEVSTYQSIRRHALRCRA